MRPSLDLGTRPRFRAIADRIMITPESRPLPKKGVAGAFANASRVVRNGALTKRPPRRFFRYQFRTTGNAGESRADGPSRTLTTAGASEPSPLEMGH